MKNLLNFLEKNTQQFELKIGSLSIKNNIFKGVVYCKPVHFQPLLNLGVRIDFTDKRVGFTSNQNHIGRSGNTNAINVSMDLETFKKAHVFFRKDFQLNILNDFQLELLNFPFTKKTK